MNSRQKIVQQQYIDNEKAVLNRLKQVYGKALDDINKNIEDLMSRTDSDTASVVYRVEYQKALKNQISGILDELNSNQFNTVSEYLATCYDDGYIGTMYDLHGQGIPIITPINQENVVRAVQLDSKISNGLYSRMGEDVSMLKKHITAQVSRGIANGSSFAQVAQQISFKMTGTYNTNGGALGNAMRIARTEGHRIQVQGAMDACYNAKEKGADIVKQWDSTLDARTRDSHAQVDGEIRELDEKFSNGLMYPADPSGGAAEVVNCRCALLQRAKWALDEKELDVLKNRAAAFGLDKTENFNEFKAKYLQLTNIVKNDKISAEKFIPAKSITEAEDYAKNVLGLDCSYKGVDLQVANEMNAAFKRGIDYCPDVKKNLHRVGSAQERNKAFKSDMTDYYYEYFKKNYPNRSEAWYQEYAKKYAGRSVGKVSGNTYAFAARQSTRGNAEVIDITSRYSGIFVNQKFGKNADDFLASIISDEKSGWHPKNSASIASVFDHEMAHQIDFALGLEKNPDILELWSKTPKAKIGEDLSRYGATNVNEFIAEAYTEWCNSPNPRPIATKVGQIIEGLVKKQ